MKAYRLDVSTSSVSILRTRFKFERSPLSVSHFSSIPQQNLHLLNPWVLRISSTRASHPNLPETLAYSGYSGIVSYIHASLRAHTLIPSLSRYAFTPAIIFKSTRTDSGAKAPQISLRSLTSGPSGHRSRAPATVLHQHCWLLLKETLHR